MRGATGTSTSKINHPADFNPHSPCGERHHKTVSRIQLSEISIHTPHAGSDRQFRKMQRLICISIHTPHAGSDSNLLPSLDRFSNFNPHSPCGERRFTSGIVHSCFVISIHTPHAGSDRWAVGVRHCRSHFNPHSPCGERLRCPYNLFKLADFNPHSPCGERRGPVNASSCSVVFQSTLPMRGATLGYSTSCTGLLIFQSTLPMRGATSLFLCHSIRFQISIHTPHAGSDPSTTRTISR